MHVFTVLIIKILRCPNINMYFYLKLTHITSKHTNSYQLFHNSGEMCEFNYVFVFVFFRHGLIDTV